MKIVVDSEVSCKLNAIAADVAVIGWFASTGQKEDWIARLLHAESSANIRMETRENNYPEINKKSMCKIIYRSEKIIAGIFFLQKQQQKQYV
jgi:hypothetical protein